MSPAAAGMPSVGSAAATGKIAIAGPGNVGTALAYACLIRGVLRVLPVPLSEDEREDLQHSASTVRAVLDKLGL